MFIFVTFSFSFFCFLKFRPSRGQDPTRRPPVGQHRCNYSRRRVTFANLRKCLRRGITAAVFPVARNQRRRRQKVKIREIPARDPRRRLRRRLRRGTSVGGRRRRQGRSGGSGRGRRRCCDGSAFDGRRRRRRRWIGALDAHRPHGTTAHGFGFAFYGETAAATGQKQKELADAAAAAATLSRRDSRVRACATARSSPNIGHNKRT